uniref:Uncharacterized protein n=1 Tax=Aegilops tauschii subsp. strangulata TaxID=200361 RepID=A0A453P4B8_AEGTS
MMTVPIAVQTPQEHPRDLPPDKGDCEDCRAELWSGQGQHSSSCIPFSPEEIFVHFVIWLFLSNLLYVTYN